MDSIQFLRQADGIRMEVRTDSGARGKLGCLSACRPDQNPRTDSGARRKAFRHPAGQALPRPGAAGTASADQSGLRLRHPAVFSPFGEAPSPPPFSAPFHRTPLFRLPPARGWSSRRSRQSVQNPSHDRQRVPSPARQERTASSSVLHFAQPEPSTWTPESDSAVGHPCRGVCTAAACTAVLGFLFPFTEQTRSNSALSFRNQGKTYLIKFHCGNLASHLPSPEALRSANAVRPFRAVTSSSSAIPSASAIGPLGYSVVQ